MAGIFWLEGGGSLAATNVRSEEGFGANGLRDLEIFDNANEACYAYPSMGPIENLQDTCSISFILFFTYNPC